MNDDALPPGERGTSDLAVELRKLTSRVATVDRMLRSLLGMNPDGALPMNAGDSVGGTSSGAALATLSTRLKSLEGTAQQLLPVVERIEVLVEQFERVEDAVAANTPLDILDARIKVAAERVDQISTTPWANLDERIQRVEERLQQLGDDASFRRVIERLDEVENELGLEQSWPPSSDTDDPISRVPHYPGDIGEELFLEQLRWLSDPVLGSKTDDNQSEDVEEDMTAVQADIDSLRDALKRQRRLVREMRRKLVEPPAEARKIEDRLRRVHAYRPASSDSLVLPTADTLKARLRSRNMFVGLRTAEGILRGLADYRMLVLQGPPGCGKTTAASLIAEALTHTAPLVAAVSPEWGEQDAIGGLRTIRGHFVPHLGAIADALVRSIESQGHVWLVLDELNRGDFAAFLAGVHELLRLPDGHLTLARMFPEAADSRGVLHAPVAFRILATMNVSDRDRTFEWSEPLRRRTAVVTLLPPDEDDERELAISRVHESLGRSTAKLSDEQGLLVLQDVAAKCVQAARAVRFVLSTGPDSSYASTGVGTASVLDAVRQATRVALDGRFSVEHAVDHALADTVVDRLVIETPEMARHLIAALCADGTKTAVRRRLEQHAKRVTAF